jgi:hypothetical protein
MFEIRQFRVTRAALLAAAGALVALFGVVLQWHVMMSRTGGSILAFARFMGYFTIQSNAAVGIWLAATTMGVRITRGRLAGIIAAALLLYMATTAIVYNLVLRAMWAPAGLGRLSDELLHLVSPLMYMLYWLFCADKRALSARHIPIWLLYPALYLIFSLVRGLSGGLYPYPFIDIGRFGLAMVMLNVAVLLALLLILSAVLIAVATRARACPRIGPVS